MLLPDIPRVYTAVAEWLACMVWLVQSKKRWNNYQFIGISILFLIGQILFLSATVGAKQILWLVCMAIAILFMGTFIFVISESSIVEAFFRCMEVFLLAEFAASLGWQLYCYVNYTRNIHIWQLDYSILIGTFIVIYSLMWYISKSFLDGSGFEVTKKELLSVIVISISIFFISNIGFVYPNTPFSSTQMADIFNARTFIDLGGVAILYAYHIQRQNLQVRYELDMMASMLEHQYVQYRQSRDTLDMINYKYHDLKHHIIALRAEEDSEKRKEYLDQMEASIVSYESMNKTGNKVLDILLTSKSLNCMTHEIDFTSVVDGTLLDFMDVMDICSIFGNALDNAIECEKKIEDKTKRMIHLSVFSQKAFLIVRCENYCEEEVDFQDNLPKTTKRGYGFHGFGLKSIQNVVHKYNGAVDISVENACFSLKILIPMQIG